MGSFRLPGLPPAPGRRPPQPGCFGLGAIAATKILFQLIKFQVYSQADNSSMTIVCCGAVSDCGNLIKTTGLAVPSPALDVLSEASGKGPGGVRGGCVSWENLRNQLKRNGPIWHQLGK